MEAHLLEELADPNACRVARHEECGDSRRLLIRPGPGEDDIQARAADVGDENLGAVQNVVVAFPSGGHRQRRGVRAGSGLGQRKGAQKLTRCQWRQPAPLLLLGAEQEDRLAAHARMHVDDDRGGRAGLRELFDADRKRDCVEPGPSVLARDQDAEQARGSGRTDSFVRKSIVAIDLRGVRQSHALRQLAHD